MPKTDATLVISRDRRVHLKSEPRPEPSDIRATIEWFDGPADCGALPSPDAGSWSVLGFEHRDMGPLPCDVCKDQALARIAEREASGVVR